MIEVDVPRGWLRRSKNGLWYTVRDIPPHRFGQRIGFAEFSKSPVEDSEPQPFRARSWHLIQRFVQAAL
jgi:hypothetical protein